MFLSVVCVCSRDLFFFFRREHAEQQLLQLSLAEKDTEHQRRELHGCADGWQLVFFLNFYEAHFKYPDYADLLMRVRGSFSTHLFE